jgi:hypothetical protein
LIASRGGRSQLVEESLAIGHTAANPWRRLGAIDVSGPQNQP